MLVYIMSIPGGMIADKVLGQKKAVLLGAIILCLGHGVLILTDTWGPLHWFSNSGSGVIEA
jgi:POT family proton-dependent oligopeptide transporter